MTESERAFAALVRDARACTACARMAHVHALSRDNGPLDARAIVVAEAPGRRGAAVTGVPLTGDEAGRRFEAFLGLAGLERGEVFVTNALLCNPLDLAGRNRAPLASEVARCRPHLERTLDLVEAPLVVALGRTALRALAAVQPHGLTLGVDVPRSVAWRGRTLVALYHPGRQSTLHRGEALQREDWRALGRLVATVARGPEQDSREAV